MRKTALDITKENLAHCLKSQGGLYELFSSNSPPHNKSNPISVINQKLNIVADIIRGKNNG